jgi:hypothetical protein
MRAQEGQRKPNRRASVAATPADCRSSHSPVDIAPNLKQKPKQPPVQKTPPTLEKGSSKRGMQACQPKRNPSSVDTPKVTKKRSPGPASQKRAVVTAAAAAAAAQRGLSLSTDKGPPSSTRSNASPNGKSNKSPDLEKQQLKGGGPSLKNKNKIDRENQSCHGKAKSRSDAATLNSGTPALKQKPLRKSRVEGVVSPVA